MARSRRHIPRLLLVVILMAAGGAPAQARSLRGQRGLVELGLFVGATYHPEPNLLFGGSGPRSLEGFAADLGFRLGYLFVDGFGIELEGALVPTATGGGQWALVGALRAHAILQYPLGRGFVPFAVLGAGFWAASSNREVGVGDDVDGAFHYGAGLKYYLTRMLLLRLDLRHSMHALPQGDRIGHRFEALLGLSVVFGWRSAAELRDTDGDGVSDAKDRCPKVSARTASGCPKDGDGDGVPDVKDKCPKVAAKTKTGCPEPKKPDATVTDSDGDGVVDAKDKCPKVAAKTDDGCPPAPRESGEPPARR